MYSLGSKGPGGGIVFYLDSSGEHGLEAKAADEPNELNWDAAMVAATAYEAGWHLPTKDELNLLYLQRTVVGCTYGEYWSSTENDSSDCVWSQYFYDDEQFPSQKRNVRPVRAVSDFEPIDLSISYGSIGPGGGVVFYIDFFGEYGLEAKAADEPDELNWFDAMTADYGSGWRLPNKEELDLLYLQRTVVGGFANNEYWSSTENDSCNAWSQLFYNGDQYNLYKSDISPVRVISDFKLIDPLLSVGSKGPGGGVVFYIDISGECGLEAKALDEPDELNWDDAMTSDYGSGWRLPNKDELDLLYQQKFIVGGFANNIYWSSTEQNGSNYAWSQYFYDGSQYDVNKNEWRPVRTVSDFEAIDPLLFLGNIGPGGGIVFYIDNFNGHGLEARVADEPNKLNWDDAMTADYGSGWRLPNKDELHLLYLQRIVVGGFANSEYWSSTECPTNTSWYMAFYYGEQFSSNKSETRLVRAVRRF